MALIKPISHDSIAIISNSYTNLMKVWPTTVLLPAQEIFTTPPKMATFTESLILMGLQGIQIEVMPTCLPTRACS